MKATSQLTVNLGGFRFRIVTPDDETADLLIRSLGEHVVPGDALLGFKIEGPASDRPQSRRVGLFVLLDAGGVVLARARDRQTILAALGGHLAALAADPPNSPIGQFRFRALVSSHDAVLVVAPLLTRPPVIERELEQIGYRVADAPFVRIDVNSASMQPFGKPLTGLAHLGAGAGHASPHELDQKITRLLWPDSNNGATRPSTAQVCHGISLAGRSGDRERRLLDAESLADQIDVVPVSVSDRRTAYTSLAQRTRPNRPGCLG